MQKFSLYILSAAFFLSAWGCGEEMLDTQNLFEKDLSNFYANQQAVEEALAGIYSSMFTDDALNEEVLVANLLSADMQGGGGADDMAAQALDDFRTIQDDVFLGYWKSCYGGIMRSNGLIEGIDKAEYTNEAERNQAKGEAYFMRAFFHFRMAKFFGGIPVFTSTTSYSKSVTRNTLDETYAQIASDLNEAIKLMPSTSFPSIPASRLGHANKWVAQAYLARVYLFYTGYKSNVLKQATTTLPLAGGGSLSKTDVQTQLLDCINNSGYALASDFRNLWPYSHMGDDSRSGYAYAKNNNLAWVGQDGATGIHGTGNLESMFMIRFSRGRWEDGNHKLTNRMALFMGLRDNSLVPFGQGWGWGTVNPKLWEEWPTNDPRRVGSILNVNNGDDITGYVGDKGMHETGYWNKKYSNLQHDGSQGVQGLFYYIYGGIPDMQLWHAQDQVLMRFADVLLMASELSEDPQYMNRVRQRAGLADVGYSLQNLKNERKWELAFEGLAWFDVLRWGDAESAFANATFPVRNYGSEVIYKVTYRPETNGLLPVPETEIRLSGGLITQNPGWGQ